jgi:hypothetical protein
MVNDRESEQLAESHLMLKNDCLCFKMSFSFVGNNPSLQIHSFSKDRGKCNKTGNPSMSDFSTILTSDIWNPVHLDRIGQIGTYWYVPVRTGTTRYKAVRESHGRTYWYVPVHTSTYTQEDKLFPDSSRKSQKR